jgi:hypothetical protein
MPPLGMALNIGEGYAKHLFEIHVLRHARLAVRLQEIDYVTQGSDDAEAKTFAESRAGG